MFRSFHQPTLRLVCRKPLSGSGQFCCATVSNRFLYANGVAPHSPGLAAEGLPEAAYPGGKPPVRFYPEGVAPPDRALTDGIEDEHE